MSAVTAAKKLLARPAVAAYAAYHAARDLDAAAHRAHLDLIEKLLVKALRPPATDWPMVWDIANDAWKFLGERAAAVWDAYEKLEADDILRLAWYARIAKQAGAFARPWLERGRARKLRPERTGSGKISRSVYEAKLDGLLGKAAKARARAVAPSDPATGYRFEAYVAAVKTAALAATRTVVLPEPIRRIHLAGRDDDITVHYLAFDGTGRAVVAKLPAIATRIPRTGDHRDPVLKAFIQRHALDGDPAAPTWDLLRGILVEELLEVVEVVGAKVRRARGCELGVGDGDNRWQRADKLGRDARAALRRLAPAARDDLLRICFETAAKRKRYT